MLVHLVPCHIMIYTYAILHYMMIICDYIVGIEWDRERGRESNINAFITGKAMFKFDSTHDCKVLS